MNSSKAVNGKNKEPLSILSNTNSLQCENIMSGFKNYDLKNVAESYFSASYIWEKVNVFTHNSRQKKLSCTI